MLMLLAVAAAQPSPEALRLGRQLAEVGTLSTLLPMMKKSEVEELISDHPELNPNDQAKLRASADRVFETGRERLLSATGRAYAEHLSIADLRSVLAFQVERGGDTVSSSDPRSHRRDDEECRKARFQGRRSCRLLQGNREALPQIAVSGT